MVLTLTRSAHAECDFQALAACVAPSTSTSISRTVWCTEYLAYVQCVEEADCVEEAGSQPAFSDERSGSCGGAVSTPKIITDQTGIHIAAPHEKKVCFRSGTTQTCVDDMALDVAVNQSLSAMTSSFDASLSVAQDTMATMSSTMESRIQSLLDTTAFQSNIIQSLTARLNATEDAIDEHCGRHCYPGEYVSSPCTESSDTVCSPCTNGTFSPGGLVDSCANCSVCGNHQLQLRACTPSSDTVCEECQECPLGTHSATQCSRNSTSHCRPFTNCDDDEYILSPGTSTSDRVCETCSSCGSGQAILHECSSHRNTVCLTCTTCQAGEIQIRPCTAGQDRVCQAPFGGFGGGWIPFNWWNGSSGLTWPLNEKNPFGNDFGSCVWGRDQHCFGRLPADLDEFKSELLVMDTATGQTGNVYKWLFDPRNEVSHAVFSVMRDSQEYPHNTLVHSVNWNPTVLRGSGPTQSQDSVQFRRTSNGVWSFMLDDDNCYCHTTLEYGRQTCNNNDYNRYGVELMDRSCVESSSLSKSLFFFYRNTSGTRTHPLGAGWNKFWHFAPGYNQVSDMLGMAYNECILGATTSDGVRYTRGVCPGRMPLGLNIDRTEMLAIDNAGTAYRWRFRSNCNTAVRVFNAFTIGGVQTYGRWDHGCRWDPIQVIGGRSSYAQDSFSYREACGVASFALDDDTCYCQTTFEAGKSLCGSGCNGNYGVDFLNDRGCSQVRNSNAHLRFYFRTI